MGKKKLFLIGLLLLVSILFTINVTGAWPQTCDLAHVGDKSCSGYRQVADCVGANSNYNYPHLEKGETCSKEEVCVVGSGCVHYQPPEEDTKENGGSSGQCSLASTVYCVGNNPSGNFECAGTDHDGDGQGDYWCERLNGNPGKIISGSTSCECSSTYPWGPRGEYGYSWCFKTSVICDASRANNARIPNGIHTGWRCPNEPDPRCTNGGPDLKCGDGKVNQASEQCDWGSSNSNSCNVPYGGSCQTCTTSCKLKTVEGGYCGDGTFQSSYEECESDNQCDDGNPYTEDSCSSCSCKNTQICQDECSINDKECHSNDLWECGDFDSDPCLEWNFKKDCSPTNENSYFQCENEDSVEVTEITNGFCKDNYGHNDYCDANTVVEEQVTDCGVTQSTTNEFCQNNDVYSQETRVERGCYEPTGKCYSNTVIKDPVLEDNCQDSQTDEFCQNENIVYGWQDETCVEENGDAYCDLETGTELVKECGPDECISHTELDPFVFEYVEDFNSCEENGYPHCALPENPVDMCLPNTDILRQPFCDGKDYDWETYDCNQKDGCYEFEVEQCVSCSDGYGNCYEKTCTITGLKYIDYQCGSGVCYGQEKEMVDADKDYKDDEYCDDCIDVDRDGICDDVDNCPGVWNENQIDNDKDGYGNACDLDRDGDGYPISIDCNDWDAGIHPGAKEIPNNGRDEDCSSATPDFMPNTPRGILYVDIQMQDEATLRAGEEFITVVSVTNMGLETIGDLTLSVSLPGFQERQAKLIRKLSSGDASARIFTFTLPKNLKTRYEYLRVSVSNDKYKRIIYREVKLPQ